MLFVQEGVPPNRVESYVREHMLRADQDKDGVLSLQEFMLWFHTEIAAALPFKRNGTGIQVSPLYNRFVYYMLADSGAGVRRKATGLQLGQFLRLCQDHNVTTDSKMARNAAQLARSSAFSDRVLGKVTCGLMGTL